MLSIYMVMEVEGFVHSRFLYKYLNYKNIEVKYKRMKRVLFFNLIFLLPFLIKASNVQLAGPTIGSNDTLANEVKIGLRVSWAKSWYCEENHTPHNWDAVWLFVKYKRRDRNDWYHATIKKTITGDLSQDTIPSDKLGTMMYRKNPGYGDFSDTITIVWDRLKDIPDMKERLSVASEVCVFAIEMVYVPKGPFYLGDGSIGQDYGVYTKEGILPYIIQTETSVSVGPTGVIKYIGVGKAPNVTPIGTYPKGYEAFYCMKTEISQGQYCDFLNKLNPLQIRSDNVNGIFSRTALDFGDETILAKYGNTITMNSFGEYEVEDPNRACNFLTSYRVLAYLAWAGLRPMSAFEYEKACRGPVTPIIGEYAWGNTRGFWAERFIEVINKPEEETYGRDDALRPNFHLRTIKRGSSVTASPGRVGAFAENNTKREQAGASYYGILDMSGGLAELVVHHWQGSPASSSFDRNHHGKGNPLRDYVGNYLWMEVPSWPIIGATSTFNTGYGHRGGSFMSKTANPGTNVNHYDPSAGQISAQGRKGGAGSGTTLTVDYYGHELDYSYGLYPSKTIGEKGFYLHGYGGRGVRSF